MIHTLLLFKRKSSRQSKTLEYFDQCSKTYSDYEHVFYFEYLDTLLHFVLSSSNTFARICIWSSISNTFLSKVFCTFYSDKFYSAPYPCTCSISPANRRHYLHDTHTGLPEIITDRYASVLSPFSGPCVIGFRRNCAEPVYPQALISLRMRCVLYTLHYCYHWQYYYCGRSVHMSNASDMSITDINKHSACLSPSNISYIFQGCRPCRRSVVSASVSECRISEWEFREEAL